MFGSTLRTYSRLATWVTGLKPVLPGLAAGWAPLLEMWTRPTVGGPSGPHQVACCRGAPLPREGGAACTMAPQASCLPQDALA